MKIKYCKYATVILLAFGLFSCEDFLDINDDPNTLLTEQVTPEYVLPGAISQAYRVQSRTMNQLGNIYMQNWGADVNNFTGANTDEYRLTLTNAFYSGIWDGLYPQISNFQRVINFNSEDYDNHKAVAYIMKSFYMQYIVDLYGDAPYSEAFQGTANVTPDYDDDKDIYRDLVVNIDRAFELFENADENDEELGDRDIVFNGDIQNWIEFGNTLKIRLLLRQSGLTDGETQAYLATEFAKVAALGQFVDENVTVDPGYSDATTNQMNPFYSLFRTTTGAGTQNDSFYRATDYVSDFLNGELSGTVVDPRRARLYVPVSGSTIAGAVQGEIEGPANMSAIGPGLIVSADQEGYLMTLAEAKFLLAEAIERGFLSGNAQAEFEAGITASFELLGIGGQAAGYIATANNVAGLGWNGDKIQAIMTQKWIALNGIHGIESWIEYTRTGFPNVPLATTAEKPNRPYRLLYPVSELVANSANVPAVTSAQAFTQGPFWKS